MTNPTGYTALDLVGFTDKGAYAGNVAYVKNDLVHYGGNVWRCLVDDTTAVTPSEGVNWTLFIGEPTNLVERIIAPIEQNPAESAWAVGRQFIYNDLLYEVITAISVGDSLVTYESTPATANIKLASPVETQLLDIKGKEGDLTNLSTTAKNTLVAAINEIVGLFSNKLDTYSAGASAWDTTPTSNSNKPVTSGGVYTAIQKCEPLIVTANSVSALPYTFQNANIETDMVCTKDILSNPSARLGEWTVNTNTAGSAVVSGTISGTTDITLYLTKSR